MFDIIYRFDPAHGNSSPPVTAADAQRLLEVGNQHFSELFTTGAATPANETHVIPFDLSEFGSDPSKAVRQAPFAVVMGCSDARVPTELVFSQAYNDLFVVRVAGNVLGSECLGSIDYAVSHLDGTMRIIVVLGHSGCGAVSAAVDSFLVPGTYMALATSHALRTVIDRISISVRSAARTVESIYGRDAVDRPGYRQTLIDLTVVIHAALTAHTLEREFTGRSAARVVFGVFDLVTHRVGLMAGSDVEQVARLHEPPSDRDTFVDLLTGLARRESVRRILDGD